MTDFTEGSVVSVCPCVCVHVWVYAFSYEWLFTTFRAHMLLSICGFSEKPAFFFSQQFHKHKHTRVKLHTWFCPPHQWLPGCSTTSQQVHKQHGTFLKCCLFFLFSCCHDSHAHQQEWLERDVKASVVKTAIVLRIFVSLATCTVFNIDMHRIILKVESWSHYCCLQYSFTLQKNQ